MTRNSIVLSIVVATVTTVGVLFLVLTLNDSTLTLPVRARSVVESNHRVLDRRFRPRVPGDTGYFEALEAGFWAQNVDVNGGTPVGGRSREENPRMNQQPYRRVAGRRSELRKPVVSRCILIEVLLLEECELGEGVLLVKVFSWRRAACLWLPCPRGIPGFGVPENSFDHIVLRGRGDRGDDLHFFAAFRAELRIF